MVAVMREGGGTGEGLRQHSEPERRRRQQQLGNDESRG